MDRLKELTRHLFSVSEERVSVMVLAFGVTLGFGLWGYIHTSHIDQSVLQLLGYEIMGITGVNVSKQIMK